MIRRYIASALIVIFFSYAAYLICYDGGKPELIGFSKLNENFMNKILILTGQKKPELTPEEKAQQADLDAAKKAKDDAEAAAKKDADKDKDKDKPSGGAWGNSQ